jgi:hypothetical protein
MVLIYRVPSALLTPPLLGLVEFETIFSATGLCLRISGATIFPTFTAPMNIIKTTIATNPALANFLAYEILSSSAKKDDIANRPTIGTAADTKTDLFGNSNGEKDDMVKSIKMPEITVASTMTISLVLRLVDEPEEAFGEAEGDAPDNGGDILLRTHSVS